jgi:hypothetical protein
LPVARRWEHPRKASGSAHHANSESWPNKAMSQRKEPPDVGGSSNFGPGRSDL